MSGGERAGLKSEQSVELVVNAIPDPPSWSAPVFPLMAAEDEAMLVNGVSVRDPDGEVNLTLNIWAEKGRIGLPVASEALLEIKQNIGEDGEENGNFVVVGIEDALNQALERLVYYPPPDWTSFKQVRKGDARTHRSGKPQPYQTS